MSTTDAAFELAFQSCGSPEIFDKIIKAYWPDDLRDEALRTFQTQAEYIAHDVRPERPQKSRDAENSQSESSVNLMDKELKPPPEAAAPVVVEFGKSVERSCAFPPMNAVSAETELPMTDDNKKEEGEIASKSEQEDGDGGKPKEKEDDKDKDADKDKDKRKSRSRSRPRRSRSPPRKRRRSRRSRDSDESESGDESASGSAPESASGGSANDFDSGSETDSRSPRRKKKRSHRHKKHRRTRRSRSHSRSRSRSRSPTHTRDPVLPPASSSSKPRLHVVPIRPPTGGRGFMQSSRGGNRGGRTGYRGRGGGGGGYRNGNGNGYTSQYPPLGPATWSYQQQPSAPASSSSSSGPTYRFSEIKQQISQLLNQHRSPQHFFDAMLPQIQYEFRDQQSPVTQGVSSTLMVRWLCFSLSLTSYEFSNTEQARAPVVFAFRSFFSMIVERKCVLYFGDQLASFSISKVAQ